MSSSLRVQESFKAQTITSVHYNSEVLNKSWTCLQRNLKKMQYCAVDHFYVSCFGFLGLAFCEKSPFFSSMLGDFVGFFVFRKVEAKMKMIANAADFSFCSG